MSLRFPAWMLPEGSEEEEPSAPAPSAKHPVLSAAFSAGINTPEKFAQMQQHAQQSHALAEQVTALTAERDALKPLAEAHQAAQTSALAAKRDAAKADAKIALKDGTPAYLAACTEIDQAGGAHLSSLADLYDLKAEAVAPKAGRQAQTQPTGSNDITRVPATDAQAGNGQAKAPAEAAVDAHLNRYVVPGSASQGHVTAPGSHIAPGAPKGN